MIITVNILTFYMILYMIGTVWGRTKSMSLSNTNIFTTTTNKYLITLKHD